MKKIVSLSLLVLIAFVFAGCGPTYTLKKDMQGEFFVTWLENNKLVTVNQMDWGDMCAFNMIRYENKTTTYAGVKILYNYPDKGININIGGFNLTETIFGINKKNGVLLSVNGKEAFPMDYYTVPYHISSRSYSTNGGGQLNHSECVECKLSMEQIAALTKARTITVTLMGTDSDPAKEQTKLVKFNFAPENFVIISKFYSEELKNKS